MKYFLQLYIDALKQEIRDILDELAEDLLGWEANPSRVEWRHRAIQCPEAINKALSRVQTPYAGRKLRKQRG